MLVVYFIEKKLYNIIIHIMEASSVETENLNQNQNINITTQQSQNTNTQHLTLGISFFMLLLLLMFFLGNFGVISIIIIVLCIIAIVNVIQTVFNISIVTYINDYFTQTPTIDIVIDTTTNENTTDNTINSEPVNQVFNVSGNNYNYNDAKAICKAFGARLANYQEMEDAYNNGAEWCNYGWSANQMALFPTQQVTYDNLQKTKKHKNSCGRPGINGGFMPNEDLKFGVNCYGHKPNISSKEKELMKSLTPYPLTQEDKDFQNKVDYWRDNINNILLSPFNYNSWGRV
jgi:hypothetical protein